MEEGILSGKKDCALGQRTEVIFTSKSRWEAWNGVSDSTGASGEDWMPLADNRQGKLLLAGVVELPTRALC